MKYIQQVFPTLFLVASTVLFFLGQVEFALLAMLCAAVSLILLALSRSGGDRLQPAALVLPHVDDLRAPLVALAAFAAISLFCQFFGANGLSLALYDFHASALSEPAGFILGILIWSPIHELLFRQAGPRLFSATPLGQMPVLRVIVLLVLAIASASMYGSNWYLWIGPMLALQLFSKDDDASSVLIARRVVVDAVVLVLLLPMLKAGDVHLDSAIILTQNIVILAVAVLLLVVLQYIPKHKVASISVGDCTHLGDLSLRCKRKVGGLSRGAGGARNVKPPGGLVVGIIQSGSQRLVQF